MLTVLHISLPLKGYVAVEVSRDGRETKREFQHIQADVEAYQAEEVGVEHLLRDVNDPTVSSLAGRIKHKLLALASLRDRLAKMAAYLAKVSSGSMEPNHEINALIQRATNLIANRECAVQSNEVGRDVFVGMEQNGMKSCTMAMELDGHQGGEKIET